MGKLHTPDTLLKLYETALGQAYEKLPPIDEVQDNCVCISISLMSKDDIEFMEQYSQPKKLAVIFFYFTKSPGENGDLVWQID